VLLACVADSGRGCRSLSIQPNKARSERYSKKDKSRRGEITGALALVEDLQRDISKRDNSQRVKAKEL
jgi:hypothetical protein